MAAEKKCAMLKKDNAGSPFKACMDKYDAEVKFDDMFDACVFDACESGNSAELLCDSFEFAENECEKNTETVHWRTENFCRMYMFHTIRLWLQNILNKLIYTKFKSNGHTFVKLK